MYELQAKEIINKIVNEETDTDMLFEGFDFNEGSVLSESEEIDVLVNEDLRRELLVEAYLAEIKLEQFREENQLNEALGFASYLNRYFTGVDPKIEERVEAFLAGMKTEGQREALLKHIDGMISTARVHNVFNNERGNGMTFSDYVKFVFKKIPYNIVSTLGNSLSGGITGLVGVVWKVVNNMNGDTAKFIETLEVLKKDVKNYKIK